MNSPFEYLRMMEIVGGIMAIIGIVLAIRERRQHKRAKENKNGNV